jgi:SnoaL-like domain
MPTPDPKSHADRWVRAWNAHDVEAVLDNSTTTSCSPRRWPRAWCPRVGVVRGKAALREYWTAALAKQPDLQFEVIGVYRGESTLVINYRNHRGELVNEVLTFDGNGMVREGHGTYLD